MSDRPTLWWAYDAEDQSFSALPAGPLLLPALFISLCIGAYSSLRQWTGRPENVLGHDFVNSVEYQQMKRRYYELIHKKIENGSLELHEEQELQQLKRPYWIKSGTWSYYP